MIHTDNNWGLVGHEWAVALLAGRLAVDRVSHAFLFTGPPGVGKTTLALRFAQALNCTGETPPCGACRSCDLIARGQHPDIQIIEAEARGKSIKIETIREMQSHLPLRPFEARFRVALVRGAQDVTPAAADALLKTLEEPSPSAKLLLTADVAEALPPTIVSRCQVIPLRPVPAAQIEAALAARGSPPEEAALLARLSGGRPGWALRGMQDPQMLSQRSAVLDDLLATLEANRAGRFAYAEAAARQDDLLEILDLWQAWWRDVLLLAEDSHVTPLNSDRRDTLEGVADSAGPEGARRALRAVRRTIDALSKNANTRLALEVMLLEMPYL